MDRRAQRPSRFRVRNIALGGLVLVAALAAGCASDSGGQSKHISVTHTGSALTVGSAVVALHQPMSGCSASDHATGPARHSANTDVASPGGPTVVSFKLTSGSYPDSYLETYYIDVDHTNTVTSGDIILGNDPFSLLAACFSTISGRMANDSLDWDEATGVIGTTTWQGDPQPYSTAGGDDEDLSRVSMSFIPGTGATSLAEPLKQ